MVMNELAMTGEILAEGSTVSVFRHFVVYGGWITWFVLIPLSVVTLALATHYLLVLRRRVQIPPRLADRLGEAGRQGNVRAVHDAVREGDSMLAQAVTAGMAQLGDGHESARSAIEEAVEERATHLLRRIEYLNVIGSIAPMIGLLGTVVGMIQAFSRIFAAGGGMPEAGKLAGDIAVALVTTFWGILIAIPALTTFAILRNRVDAFAAETVKLSDGLVNLLGTSREPRAVRAEGA